MRNFKPSDLPLPGAFWNEVIKSLENIEPGYFELVRRERPYRIPKGYIPWEKLSGMIGASLLAHDRQLYDRGDLATQLTFHRNVLWFLQDAPIYCLSTNLLRAFEQTEIWSKERLFRNLEIPLPTFMLLFPQNAVKSPAGATIDYAIVHTSDTRYPENSVAEGYGLRLQYLEHKHPINVHWSAIDSTQTVWFTGTGISEDGRLLIDEDEQVGLDPLSAKDKEFTHRLRSVALQCLLAIAYMPELLEGVEAAGVERAARGRGKESNRPVRAELHPRWIGRSYQPKTEGRASKGGSHASPVTHWRSGHYREQPYGPGLSQSKTIWIQPVQVNGGK